MTLGHFIYIPGILLLGIVIGYVLGGRASQVRADDNEEKDARQAARDARRRAREAERAESDQAHAPDGGAASDANAP